MAAIQGASGNKQGMDAAYSWEMYPPGRAGGGQPAHDERELPTLDKISSMFGGPFDASQLVPIEEVQRLAEQIREGNAWSSTHPSSGR